MLAAQWAWSYGELLLGACARLLEGLERSVFSVHGGNNNNKLYTMRLPETLFWASLFICEVRHVVYIS